MHWKYLLIFASCFTAVYSAPPAFQSTPPPVAVARLRESLLLRCRVVGKPPPDVTWRKDGWLLRNDENGIKIKGGELLIRSLTKTHRGNYKCQGRNSEGQVDHVTKVLVQAAPEITVSPMDLRITEGQDGFFYCKADGYPDDITYSWYYNGVAADDSSQLMGRYRTFNDGTLEIESVRQEDSGNVSCVASNDFGSSPSVSARLIIQYAAQVVDMPPIAYAAVSLPITLHCPYMAEPPVTTVTWRKNGNTVGIAKDENGQIYATENNELKFKAVQYSDEGIYTCTPYNILGTSGESTNMRMVVRESPRFTGRPKDNYEAEIGKPFMTSCNGNGNPPPTVTWQKVGASDEYYDQYRLSRNDNNLTISSISKQDHGLWQCVLTNAVARVTANVSINVKYTTPHAARDVNVTTSSGNATVSWTPGYDGGYPQHFVVWYKRVDKGDQAWSTASVEGGRKVVTVSRLEHETVYQFSVLSENVLGSGSFSKTVTKKTKALPKRVSLTRRLVSISPPHDLQHTIDSGMIVLGWKLPDVPVFKKLLGFLIEFQKQDKQFLQPIPLGQFAYDQSGKKKQTDSNLAVGSLVENPSPPEMNPWKILNAVSANTTSYIIPGDSLDQDRIYRFRILSVSIESYGLPSSFITVSTEGMTFYRPSSLVGAYSTTFANDAGLQAGIITGSIFVILVVALSIGYWHRTRTSTYALQRTSYLKAEAVESFLAKTKRESDWPRSSEINCNDEPPKVLFSRVVNEVTDDFGIENLNQGEMNKTDKMLLTRDKVKRSKSLSHNKDPRKISSIERSTDGKFRVSEVNSSEDLSIRKSSFLGKMRYPQKINQKITSRRPVSDCFIPRETQVLFDGTEVIEEEGMLEIDCSRSDIEVRYHAEDSHSFNSPYRHPTVPRLKLISAPNRSVACLPPHIQTSRDNKTQRSLYQSADYVYLKDIGASCQDNTNQSTLSTPVSMTAVSRSCVPTHDPYLTEHSKKRFSQPRDVLGETHRSNLMYDCRNSPSSSLGQRSKRHSNGNIPVSFETTVGTFKQEHQGTNELNPMQPQQMTSAIFRQPTILPRNESTKNYKKVLRRTSYSNSLPSLKPTIKGSRVKKDLLLFRRSISEETLGLVVSDNDSGQRISFTSGSASTVRQLSSKENISNDGFQRSKNERAQDDQSHSDLLRTCRYNMTLPKPSPPEINSCSGYESQNCSSSDTSHRSYDETHENIHSHPLDSRSRYFNHYVNQRPLFHNRIHDTSSFGYPHHTGPRCSNASPFDFRSRKDTSSVDDKYEWDSEYAMESEIIEAIKTFESFKGPKKVSKGLRLQLQTLGIEDNPDTNESQTESEYLEVTNDTICGAWSSPSPEDDNYTKASIEKRCAALKQEYMEYQRRKTSDNDTDISQ